MSETELPSLEVCTLTHLGLMDYMFVVFVLFVELYWYLICVFESNIGSFAMWGGVFSSVDCLLIYYRQSDDPFNAIIAGTITGGVLAIRGKYWFSKIVYIDISALK